MNDSGDGQPADALPELIDRVAHVLPAQGPIELFIHHNVLHAFEAEPFDDAAIRAAELFGCKAFLEEKDYRLHLSRGRIEQRDLSATVERHLGPRALEQLAPGVTRGELWHLILQHGIPDVAGEPLKWLLSETPALRRFRVDLPHGALESLRSRSSLTRVAEAEQVGALWRACAAAVLQSSHSPTVRSVRRLRHRDIFLEAGITDLDEAIHPVLIRFTSAYLDQGLARWTMPGRERGMFACFFDLYGRRLTRLAVVFGRDLLRLVRDDISSHRTAFESLAHSLLSLGVARAEWEAYLTAEALALRGWAGMVRQFEQRPERVPVCPFPARLVDFLAIRLLLARAAIAHSCRALRIEASEVHARCTPQTQRPSIQERTWQLFNVAQLCGIGAAAVGRWSGADVGRLEEGIDEFGSVTRRRLFHTAFEAQLRDRFLDAMSGHRAQAPIAPPAYQAIFCIDEREESLRRHWEEVDPQVETFGTAGFFGVAMYHRSATDARARPLCPAAVSPRHFVRESQHSRPTAVARLARSQGRLLGLVGKKIHIGSRTMSRGAAIMATVGVLWLVPLVLRVLFPWSRRGLEDLRAVMVPRECSRLELHRTAATPPIGEVEGFTVDEMAEIVREQLVQMGMSERLAPLIFAIGHGSSSLNNPQESAHDCGACGGGPGGPNARAFAQMANDPDVRARLEQLGVSIPSDTWFLGAQRNTANSDIVLFDEDLVPGTAQELFRRAKSSLERARRREAHERCRRFESTAPNVSEEMALAHVQARAVDLAQPRPEYGHATNAFCIVGRRSRTRGLFLDRRAFLASYDFSGDSDGAILGLVLRNVVPVVAGINLEYLFGFVDPTGYGCGTKLPHNVASLLGVMDGMQSDLRTGLPWQMLEIHEPVRLTVVVEAPAETLLRTLDADSTLKRLVENRWITVGTLDPDSNQISLIDLEGAHPYTPGQPAPPVAGSSRDHYQNQRGHLSFVSIVSTRGARRID